jgi:hypothetical protein
MDPAGRPCHTLDRIVGWHSRRHVVVVGLERRWQARERQLRAVLQEDLELPLFVGKDADIYAQQEPISAAGREHKAAWQRSRCDRAT